MTQAFFMDFELTKF